jgi:hypothetical protein
MKKGKELNQIEKENLGKSEEKSGHSKKWSGRM